MDPIYAIGDVHGHFDKLTQAIEWIERDGGGAAPLIVLGDLVDRGPDSFRVIELLRLGQAEGLNWTVLRGNHDEMFVKFVTEGKADHPRIRPDLTWLDPIMGGATTLKSYGVVIEDGMAEVAVQEAARDAVSDDHLAFLENCPLVHQAADMLFVHAGVRPGVDLNAQDPDDLLWIREPFLSHPDPFEWLVVHGHTSIEAPQHYGTRVNLDSGAGHGRALSAAVFEGGQVFTLGSEGRTPLLPNPLGFSK